MEGALPTLVGPDPAGERTGCGDGVLNVVCGLRVSGGGMYSYACVFELNRSVKYWAVSDVSLDFIL
jgi:hypothetical protein